MYGGLNDALLIAPETKKNRAKCIWNWNCSMIVISGVVIALAIATIIVFLAVFGSRDSERRNCIEAVGARAGTASPGVLIGGIAMDLNARRIDWDLQYRDLTSDIIGVQIHGPVPAGLQFAPCSFALCGTPSTLLCDISEPNVLEGWISEINPDGTSLRPAIQAIRNEPWRYYVQINTVTFPGVVDDGELIGPLDMLCGT